MSAQHIPVINPYWQWQRGAGSLSLPSLADGPDRVDVAIIGGGLAGLSTAYHVLQRLPGLRVCVLEADVLGAGASGRTTGMLSPGVGQSLPALVRRVGPVVARQLYEQTLAAVRGVQTRVEAEGIDCDLRLGGQVMFARSLRQRRKLARLAQCMDALGLRDEVQCLDDAALAARLRLPLAFSVDGERELNDQPHPNDSNPPAALRFPTAGIVDPLRLIIGLCQRVLSRGGQVYEQARVLHIDGLDPREHSGTSPTGPVRLMLTDPTGPIRREIRADHVVVAAAGFAPRLGLWPGRLLPVQLQAIVSEPIVDATLNHLGWTDRDGFIDARRVFSYFRLTEDRRIVFGGARPRYAWGGGDGSQADLSRALSQVATDFRATFPAELGIGIVGGWGGTIGYVVDALPAIGRLSHAPRILHAVGWCGHGVALAMAAGSWLASSLAGDPLPDLPWFRSTLPHVPTELGRFVGFAAATRYMALQDAWT